MEPADARGGRLMVFPSVAPRNAGVMIYYPVFGAFPSFFGGSMDDYLRDTVSTRKDVEGLCHTYRRNLYHNVRCAMTGRYEHTGR